MAIRNEKLGGTDFADGEVLYDYDLDDTFNAVAYRLIDRDDTPVTTQSLTAVDAYTVNIPANTIKRFIDINVEGKYKIRDDNTGGSRSGIQSVALDVYIGESGSEVLVKSFVQNMQVGGEIAGILMQVSHKLYYEPTTSEKNNGFNVIFKIRAISIEPDGPSNDYCGYNSSYIMGA